MPARKLPKRSKSLFQLVCVVGPRLKNTARQGRPRKMASNEASRKNDKLLRENAGCYWKPIR